MLQTVEKDLCHLTAGDVALGAEGAVGIAADNTLRAEQLHVFTGIGGDGGSIGKIKSIFSKKKTDEMLAERSLEVVPVQNLFKTDIILLLHWKVMEEFTGSKQGNPVHTQLISWELT